jgi:hypothetical protein
MRHIEGVLTMPLAFDKVIPLKGKAPEEFALHHEVILETVHLHVPGRGVVSFNAENQTQIFGMQNGDRQMTVMIRGNFEMHLDEDTMIKFNVFGAICLINSFVDMEGYVNDYRGLSEAPTLLGFDLKMYDAIKEPVAEAEAVPA